MSDLVLSKKQNYHLWQSGAYGNKLRSWRTLDALKASGLWFEGGHVALRELGRAGGGLCAYDLDCLGASLLYDVWLDGGIPSDVISFDEMAPAELTTLQGEYLNDIDRATGSWGTFLYSFAQAPMRTALRDEPRYADGLRADLLIRNAMTPASFEDWQELTTRYPGHVFEVSIYDCCLGDLPNRNALVWEIRRY